MKKIKISYIKKYLISVISVVFVVALVIYSENNLESAKKGLNLWWNSVVPSLFPFFVATELLCTTNVINYIGKLIEKPMEKIFNVPGEGAFALVMGIISGYPAGAKIVSEFKEKGICTKAEAERLIAFTNNSGPLFVLGTVGISLFNDRKVGESLLIVHIISCILVGIVFRNWKKNENKSSRKTRALEKRKEADIGEILGISIKKSINTILMIGGFIVIFSVIISIFNSSRIF